MHNSGTPIGVYDIHEADSWTDHWQLTSLKFFPHRDPLVTKGWTKLTDIFVSRILEYLHTG